MQKTQAIILNAMRYGESGHIVHLLTREHGLVSCLVKGGRKHAVLSPVLMQPLSLIDALIDMRPTRQIQFMRESSPAVLLQTIPCDPIKNSIAFFLSEMLYRVLRQAPADERLFDFVQQSICLLDETDKGVANFHLVFLIKLTYFLGFFPNLSDFDANVFFDMENSQFVPQQLNAHTLNEQETAVFVQLMRMDYANMHVFSLSRVDREAILEHIISYYRLHVPELGEIKSLAVLQQLFA